MIKAYVHDCMRLFHYLINNRIIASATVMMITITLSACRQIASSVPETIIITAIETTAQTTITASNPAQTLEYTTAQETAAKAPETTTQAPKHEHSYSSKVTKEPACTSEGARTFYCSCGDSYAESIPATGHSFGDYVYNNDATTSADGTKTATCSVCGAKDTVTAGGTKKELPSWYDEHPDKPHNVETGGFDDGSLERYFTDGYLTPWEN